MFGSSSPSTAAAPPAAASTSMMAAHQGRTAGIIVLSRRHERARVPDLGPIGVAGADLLHEPAIVRAGFLAIAGQLGRARGAIQAAEAARLLGHRRLVLSDSFRGPVELEQHIAQQ